MKFTIVEAYDEESAGLYVDGVLVTENVSAESVLTWLVMNTDHEMDKTVRWFPEKNGNVLPNLLKDVVRL